jgi:hypothetical protein
VVFNKPFNKTAPLDTREEGCEEPPTKSQFFLALACIYKNNSDFSVLFVGSVFRPFGRAHQKTEAGLGALPNVQLNSLDSPDPIYIPHVKLKG